MAKETNVNVANDMLRLLSAGMEAALVKPKEPTSDALCVQLHEANVQPNAFRKRLVKRRRALGQDDGTAGTSGRASAENRARRGGKRK